MTRARPDKVDILLVILLAGFIAFVAFSPVVLAVLTDMARAKP